MKNNRITTLEVEGMGCSSCVGNIDELLRAIAGVANVEVQLDDNKVVVEYDPQRASLERLLSVLRDAGYPGVESER